MAQSVNKAVLIGNLGKDPEVRSTQGGSKVVSMTVATSETWKDRQSGEKREATEWHRIVIWNENIGNFVEQYLRKGDKVYLEGKLQTRKWTDQQGADRYTTEIVLQAYDGKLVSLTSRLDNQGGGEQSRANQNNASRGTGYGRNDVDDEIPF
ncbi:single-stranded DNA-binding protein [Nguyenibacter vanlangensis]|uniref:Single-stranded DNA-binding protein n=1 Tax=Nguyenibacter vanlangensis TaxID=1216886 RepID=A0ABZ3D269_9PROT